MVMSWLGAEDCVECRVIECIRGCSSVRSGISRVDKGINNNDGSKTKACLHMDSETGRETLPAASHEEAALGLGLRPHHEPASMGYQSGE